MWKRGCKAAMCLVGVALCFYPLARGLLWSKEKKQTIASYESKVEERGEYESILEDARRYNTMLCQTRGAVIEGITEEVLSDESYEKQLNPAGNGIMGTIEIPKINVCLPIWHGVNEEALQNGAGHLPDTSLPVGGKNTRSIITGHRGIPGAKLFTRLDELQIGDLFYIEVCKQTFAYQIYDVEVIEPDDLEKLLVLPERDIVSLVTCTPYGINTHRLVVNGERVDYKEKVKEEIKPRLFSFREMLFSFIPMLAGIIVAVTAIKNIRKRCKDGRKESIYKEAGCSDDTVPFRGRSRKRKRTSRGTGKYYDRD